jgi:hypothetical protein
MLPHGKVLVRFFTTIILLVTVSTAVPAETTFYDLYAGPFGVAGSSLQVYSVFGANTGCSITIAQDDTNGPARIQVSVNGKDWQEYIEGTFIQAQTVSVRAISAGTGGTVHIAVDDHLVHLH